MNRQIAQELLGDNGLFLRDGLDEEVSIAARFDDTDTKHLQGRTNNLAHPALAGLVIDFFYGGDKSVGRQFPEVFDTEVPRVAVALAATAVMFASLILYMN